MHPLILISDNNSHDIYNSILKFSIVSQCPVVHILEYYTGSDLNKINKSAAYILLNEYQFTTNSVFYIEVNASRKILHQKILLIQYEDKWILTPDNGILGLLENEKVKKIYYWKEYIQSGFYAKNEMLNGLKSLIDSKFKVNNEFESITYEVCERLHWPSIIERKSENGEKKLIVPLLYVDSYQNLIFKFRKSEFEKYTHTYDISIQLPLGEKINHIQSVYNQTDSNELLAIFNDAGYLEIAVNGGNLAPLIVNKDIYYDSSHSIILTLKPKK